MQTLLGVISRHCLKQTRTFCACSSTGNNRPWAIIGSPLIESHCESSPQHRHSVSAHRSVYTTHTCGFSTSLWRHRADNTVDQEEVDKFNRLAETMWDEGGGMRGLHSMNQLRVPLVRDALLRQRALERGEVLEEISAEPLQGMKVMDVGCGAGILSEPLARLGAKVTGLDAAVENVAMARWHSSLDPGLTKQLRYVCEGVEDFSSRGAEAEQYDAVVASEILEHVVNLDSFVRACCSLVKPGGSIFFTTLNKTPASFLVAKMAAEYIFRIVDPGTHDWNKFVSPEELQTMLSENNMVTRLIHGMTWNPATNKWCWVQRTDVNYAVHAVKPMFTESDSSTSDSDSDGT